MRTTAIPLPPESSLMDPIFHRSPEVTTALANPHFSSLLSEAVALKTTALKLSL
jgi:hypothetical protein